jgi:NAD(P)-dependent dehydrogenase (short-subunit alcohol dehydrogenase family)
MLAITGFRSRISQEVIRLLWRKDYAQRFDPAMSPLDANRYLFCAGVLAGKSAATVQDGEIEAMLSVNFSRVVLDCERILEANPEARICIIGSESGYSGSFDRIYSGSKAAIHSYIETRRLRPHQQLVGVAPGIIEDAGMTLRRTDHANLEKRKACHPKQRFVTSEEVARLILFLLYEDRGYISNTVIRMNGGERAR